MRGQKSSATLSQRIQRQSHCGKEFCTSSSSSPRCTTSWNKSPSPTSCENSNNASAPKPSVISGSASADNYGFLNVSFTDWTVFLFTPALMPIVTNEYEPC